MFLETTRRLFPALGPGNGTVQSGGGIVALVPGMIFNGLGIPWKVPTGDSLVPFFSNFNGRVERVIAICLK